MGFSVCETTAPTAPTALTAHRSPLPSSVGSSSQASPRWRGELLKRRRGGEALIHYSLPGGFEGQSLLDASNVGPNTSHPGQVRAWLKVMKLSAVDARHYDPNKGELLDVHSSPQMKRRLQSAPSAPSTPTPRTPVRAKPIKFNDFAIRSTLFATLPNTNADSAVPDSVVYIPLLYVAC